MIYKITSSTCLTWVVNINGAGGVKASATDRYWAFCAPLNYYYWVQKICDLSFRVSNFHYGLGDLTFGPLSIKDRLQACLTTAQGGLWNSFLAYHRLHLLARNKTIDQRLLDRKRLKWYVQYGTKRLRCSFRVSDSSRFLLPRHLISGFFRWRDHFRKQDNQC